eukprot:Pgem_evm1s6682
MFEHFKPIKYLLHYLYLKTENSSSETQKLDVFEFLYYTLNTGNGSKEENKSAGIVQGFLLKRA